MGDACSAQYSVGKDEHKVMNASQPGDRVVRLDSGVTEAFHLCFTVNAYDVAIFGNLTFRKRKLDTWLDDTVDSRAFRAIARVFPKRRHHAPTTVRELIAELPTRTGHGLFEVAIDGGEVRVHGLVARDAFDLYCRQIAALFMSAATLGATGDVCMLGQGVFVGYGISVGEGEANLLVLSDDEVQNASMAPELDTISGYFQLSEIPHAPGTLSAEDLAARHLLDMSRPGGAMKRGPAFVNE